MPDTKFFVLDPFALLPELQDSSTYTKNDAVYYGETENYRIIKNCIPLIQKLNLLVGRFGYEIIFFSSKDENEISNLWYPFMEFAQKRDIEAPPIKAYILCGSSKKPDSTPENPEVEGSNPITISYSQASSNYSCVREVIRTHFKIKFERLLKDHIFFHSDEEVLKQAKLEGWSTCLMSREKLLEYLDSLVQQNFEENDDKKVELPTYAPKKENERYFEKMGTLLNINHFSLWKNIETNELFIRKGGSNDCKESRWLKDLLTFNIYSTMGAEVSNGTQVMSQGFRRTKGLLYPLNGKRIMFLGPDFLEYYKCSPKNVKMIYKDYEIEGIGKLIAYADYIGDVEALTFQYGKIGLILESVRSTGGIDLTIKEKPKENEEIQPIKATAFMFASSSKLEIYGSKKREGLKLVINYNDLNQYDCNEYHLAMQSLIDIPDNTFKEAFTPYIEKNSVIGKYLNNFLQRRRIVHAKYLRCQAPLINKSYPDITYRDIRGLKLTLPEDNLRFGKEFFSFEEHYSLQTSDFCGVPIQFESNFDLWKFGEEKKMLEGKLSNLGGKMLGLFGDAGVGKEEILAAALKDIKKENEFFDVKWFNMRNKQILNQITLLLANNSSEIEFSTENLVEKMYENFVNEKGKYILVFDNAHSYDEIENYMKIPIPNNIGIVVIFSSNPGKNTNINEMLSLKALDNEKVLSLLHDYQLNLESKSENRFYTEFGKNRYLLNLVMTYSKIQNISLNDFLTCYDETAKELQLLNEETVQKAAVIMQMIINKHIENHPDIQHFLIYCSYLAPNFIPVKLIEGLIGAKVGDVINLLEEYSIIIHSRPWIHFQSITQMSLSFIKKNDEIEYECLEKIIRWFQCTSMIKFYSLPKSLSKHVWHYIPHLAWISKLRTITMGNELSSSFLSLCFGRSLSKKKKGKILYEKFETYMSHTSNQNSAYSGLGYTFFGMIEGIQKKNGKNKSLIKGESIIKQHIAAESISLKVLNIILKYFENLREFTSTEIILNYLQEMKPYNLLDEIAFTLILMLANALYFLSNQDKALQILEACEDVVNIQAKKGDLQSLRLKIYLGGSYYFIGSNEKVIKHFKDVLYLDEKYLNNKSIISLYACFFIVMTLPKEHRPRQLYTLLEDVEESSNSNDVLSLSAIKMCYLMHSASKNTDNKNKIIERGLKLIKSVCGSHHKEYVTLLKHKGINLCELTLYEESTKSLELYINRRTANLSGNIKSGAIGKAYFYAGKSYFHSNQFQKAIDSLNKCQTIIENNKISKYNNLLKQAAELIPEASESLKKKDILKPLSDENLKMLNPKDKADLKRQLGEKFSKAEELISKELTKEGLNLFNAAHKNYEKLVSDNQKENFEYNIKYAYALSSCGFINEAHKVAEKFQSEFNLGESMFYLELLNILGAVEETEKVTRSLLNKTKDKNQMMKITAYRFQAQLLKNNIAEVENISYREIENFLADNFESLHEDDNINYYRTLSLHHTEKENYEKGREYAEKCMENVGKKNANSNRIQKIKARILVGQTYYYTDKLSLAWNKMMDAYEEAGNMFGPANIFQIIPLKVMGEIALKNKEFNESTYKLSEALKISTKHHGDKHIYTAQIQMLLGESLGKLPKFPDALNHFSTGLKNYKEWYNNEENNKVAVAILKYAKLNLASANYIVNNYSGEVGKIFGKEHTMVAKAHNIDNLFKKHSDLSIYC